MKKKHLTALNSLEKWLAKNDLHSEELEIALETIRNCIQSVAEEVEKLDEKLPPPAEISEDPQAIALYADGGCRGNPGPGAFAYVAQTHEGEILTEGVEFEGLTTNNKMELGGAIRGLRDVALVLKEKGREPLLTKVKVVTDSKYVVEGMKSWVSGWKARGWKKADNKVPENLELWQELDGLRETFMQLEWQWVKGHAGHPQNEYCDRKANELMDENAAR
jgi:ribonuclease HI